MKKILWVSFILVITACTAFWFIKKPNPISEIPNEIVAYQGTNQTELEETYGKVLIVYYSFTGTTYDTARNLQEQTGGDLYRLQLEEDYPATVMIYWQTRNQINANQLPTLKKIVPHIDDYDLIIIGSPVWWYTTPPPLRSYLEQTDFKGKTVAVFCTLGGREETYFTDFKQRAKNAHLTEKLRLESPKNQSSDQLNNTISNWLSQLQKNNE